MSDVPPRTTRRGVPPCSSTDSCQPELRRQDQKAASYRWTPPDILGRPFPGDPQTFERVPGLAKDREGEICRIGDHEPTAIGRRLH